ncbi:unnamed protein product [Mycena citricolor]|uniref:Fungal-type protein kinase domain-containing protein n=2 Tax=Mycena citricolor TaxID=2018698 RepID=A0AAD2HII3_9AGAR|nr:unnamed protein product [Mycena citricolor]
MSDSIMREHLRGFISVDEMLETMGKDGQEEAAFIMNAVSGAQSQLDEAHKRCDLFDQEREASEREETESEDSLPLSYEGRENPLVDRLIPYLQQVVSQLPSATAPTVIDTCNMEIPLNDADQAHKTQPDIAFTRPGIPAPQEGNPLRWSQIGTFFEVKDSLNFIVAERDSSAGEMMYYPRSDDEDESTGPLAEWGERARSLLAASGACCIYLVTFIGRSAHLFRFDTAGYQATPAFDWYDKPTVLPRFLYRLYNPRGHPGRMPGDDYTIVPTEQAERERLHAAMVRRVKCMLREAGELEQQPDEPVSTSGQNSGAAAASRTTNAEKASRLRKLAKAQKSELRRDDWLAHSCVIPTVMFQDDEATGRRSYKLVHCLTAGPLLWASHSLFGRATKVFRVILREDLDADNPTVYALKDSWRQGSRRPEVDFYDVIREGCRQKGIDTTGMAQCHGCFDMSFRIPSIPAEDATWDPSLHRTASVDLLPEQERDVIARYHTRTLLTPVGRRLSTFSSVRELVDGLYDGLKHLHIAEGAGVRHRDVSHGNVMFDAYSAEVRGFLLDYDYAEFSEEGLETLKQVHARLGTVHSLYYPSISKTLKELTGTLSFLALDLALERADTHEHYHDLESFYWLLIWTVLRHTRPEIHCAGKDTCADLFGPSSSGKKFLWVLDFETLGPTGSVLHELSGRLVTMVQAQNAQANPFPRKSSTATVTTPEKLSYEEMSEVFSTMLEQNERWDALEHSESVPDAPSRKRGRDGVDNGQNSNIVAKGNAKALIGYPMSALVAADGR